VIQFKQTMLARAWDNFRGGAASTLRPEFDRFVYEQAHWLKDYALFMALKDAHDGESWFNWEAGLVLRDEATLQSARRKLSDSIGRHQFAQFLFFRQWEKVREFAHSKGIRLIGDVPIFVSSDSADVWSNPELFQLDETRQPTVVAGVPPDYFSATGQLWGNPLYNWEALQKTSYAWWVARMRATLTTVDLVRIDHFRGFESYWEIPAGMPTAEVGRWAKGPGAELFETLRDELGGLPLIAEDLGIITPEVEALRDRFGLPGMRILQFAFGGDPTDRFLPHNYKTNTIVYTGTHDNDTTIGWFNTMPGHERGYLWRYNPHAERDIAWELLRMGWGSIADLAIAPLQDVLRLGTEARMNYPGRPAGNWTWRLAPHQLTRELIDQLGEMTEVYGRYQRGLYEANGNSQH
jgi:4-alpha-glucanotransferase